MLARKGPVTQTATVSTKLSTFAHAFISFCAKLEENVYFNIKILCRLQSKIIVSPVYPHLLSNKYGSFKDTCML